ncbi:unnamed protein product, partial [Linum tenue]
GLGPSDSGGGAVRAADSRPADSDPWEEQSGGVREHADQRRFHLCPRHHLLRSNNHLPHRHRRPHICWLINQDSVLRRQFPSSLSPLSLFQVSPLLLRFYFPVFGL